MRIVSLLLILIIASDLLHSQDDTELNFFFCEYDQSFQFDRAFKHSCDTFQKSKKSYYSKDSKQFNKLLDSLGQKVKELYSIDSRFRFREHKSIKSFATVNCCCSQKDEPIDRFILYNPLKMDKFLSLDNQLNWAGIGAFLHEIGHHLNGDVIEGFSHLDTTYRRHIEREADIFSGYVMFFLGANLENAQLGINTLIRDSKNPNYPSKKDRLNAIKIGWNRAKRIKLPMPIGINRLEPEFYARRWFEVAYLTAETYQFDKAIEYYKTAIEIFPAIEEARGNIAYCHWMVIKERFNQAKSIGHKERLALLDRCKECIEMVNYEYDHFEVKERPGYLISNYIKACENYQRALTE